MRVRDLSGYRELLYAALIIFSAVSLATLEFLKNDYPDIDVLLVPKTTVVYMILLVQVLPALVLLVADRLIAARYGAGRRLRIFRSVLFALALLLILRQLELYWDPAADFADSVRSRSLEQLVFVDLLFVAAVVGLAIWAFRGLLLFFLLMSPVAIAMTAIIPSQVPTRGSLPATYGQEVVTATQSESQPAVFILVFDELGYDVLLNKDGELDAESFPNIAALVQDGVWFTNATTNNYWTADVLPTIIDPVKSLSEQYNIRLYAQLPFIERRYINDCGKVMTCRGVSYLTENEQLRVAGYMALRSFYQATPKWVETAISRPMGWLLDPLDWAYPSVDWVGAHVITKRQFGLLLDDIKGREALGRIHVLHLFLPHEPDAFNGEGKALSSPGSYREQVMFADRLVGQLISKLKREGIYDETVIVLTGDHGERIYRTSPGPGERPILPSPESPPQSIPHVPLVIRAPSLSSRVSDVDYQHIDFGPTLTDILGLPPPNDTEGVSAFSQERPQRDKVFHSDKWTFIYSRVDDSWYVSQEE